jgi:myo-inositol 2-dehydrogenase / D-chiro-inositol 1-dehydrogenase
MVIGMPYKKLIVVILAAPPGFRPDHFEEAVKQNKQIFMEKAGSH